ncbi:MAG: V-type ATP synthase subunit F [Promethearchaeota archaeon]|jgi:vacuolar-type H+-ATPase subunit F/Vma7
MVDQEVFIIGDEDIVLMLGLLGLNGIVVEGEEEFLKKFNELTKQTRIGMILIATPLSGEIINYLLEFKLNNRKPFIFMLPDVFQPNVDVNDPIYNKIYESISDIVSL